MAKTQESAPVGALAIEETVRTPQQERGHRRVDSILDAAEQLIVEAGVDATTTNAIAERAGASMGSIYHFFPGKDAILVALARRYAERMRDLNAGAMSPEAMQLPLPTLFENIIWGHASFIERTPAFAAVQEATARKFGACSVAEELDEAIIQQVRTFLEVRYPGMPADKRLAATRVSVVAVGQTVEATARLPHDERDAMLNELRDMLVRYFEPLDREFAAPR